MRLHGMLAIHGAGRPITRLSRNLPTAMVHPAALRASGMAGQATRSRILCPHAPMDQPSTSARGGAPVAIGRVRRRCDRLLCRHKIHEFSLWRGELPSPPGLDTPGAVAGAATRATPLLTPQRVLDRLNAGVHENARAHFGAFFSSELGGIVTNPALMAIHIDDHLVHRGHGVSTTVPLVQGHLYQLPRYMQAFKRSVYQAGITLPLSGSAMARVIMDTVAASKKSGGAVKFWASAGRGGTGISTKECVESTVYVMVTSEPSQLATYQEKGMAAHASNIPPRPAAFRAIGSTDHLQNALAMGDGSDVGVFTDGDGNILEAPVGCIGIVAKGGTVVVPPFENTAHYISMQRLVELLEKDGASVEQRPVHASEMKTATEAFVVSGCDVVAITKWEGKAIGNGKPGPSTDAFARLFANDVAAQTNNGKL